MKKNSFKQGFTLIELLVVVAIIGILASVVLASLNSARTKAIDVAIKAAMANARAQAAIYYEDHSQSYGTSMCASDTPDGIYPIVLNAVQRLNPTAVTGAWMAHAYTYSATGDSNVDPNGTNGDHAASVCHASATAWAAITSLKSTTIANGGWCVDSAGASKEVDNLLANETDCD